MSIKFQKLLEPGYIGSVKTNNRMLKMGAYPGFFPFEGGYMQQAYIDYYVSLAKGGVGLVTVGAAPVGDPGGKGYSLDDDKYIPRMKEMTDEIRKYCPAFMQMFHIGNWIAPAIASTSFTREDIPIKSYPLPRGLSVPEIKDVVKQFGVKAERIRKSGFQGIELNAGCSHFLDTFLSSAWNKRKDEYGGSLENRARIVCEIIQEIKIRNGKDFPVIALFNAAEPGLEGGITAEEGREFAKIFEAAGADAIEARVEFYTVRKTPVKYDSTHFPDVAFFPEPPPYAARDLDITMHGRGGWAPLAGGIKKVVKIPVISTGRLDPELGEKLLREGKVDFINMNRRLMADHDLPNKIKEGRLEDIVPCTACMTCFDSNERGLPPKCRINATFGKEREYEIKPAVKKKKVLIIGAGPAGLEAARVAALRGHQVTIYDKSNRLGGSMNLAAVVKGTEREDLPAISRYFKTQFKKLGVEVRLNREVNKALVKKMKPEVVIVAAGGKHAVPQVKGINNPKVKTSEQLHKQLKGYLQYFSPQTLIWLTNLYMPVGKKAVIMGGNIQGCQTAEFLVKRDKKVSVVETEKEIGTGLLENLIRPQLLDWLDKKNVPMMAGVKYEEITDKGLTVSGKEGKKQILEADTILTAIPLAANMQLVESFKGTAPEVYAIGDSREPGLIVDAIADGARIARAI